MDIDMRALKQLELDDAIPFSELVQIIEAAVLVAYHKHVGLQPKRDEPERFRASLDQKTGQVTIWGKEVDEEGNLSSEETEVTPEGFGRIAAYSAKSPRWHFIDSSKPANEASRSRMPRAKPTTDRSA